MLDAERWSGHSKNSTRMDNNETAIVYGYFRNGGIFVTPSLELAWKRHTHDEPFIVYDPSND